MSHSSDRGGWYKAGAGLAPIRRVFVRDQTGTYREEYFFTTDQALTPAQVIGTPISAKLEAQGEEVEE